MPEPRRRRHGPPKRLAAIGSLISIKAQHAKKALALYGFLLETVSSAPMILFVTCPNCRHGATSAALPRALVCSRCGQSALVTEGEPVRSPIRMREDAQREEWECDRTEQAGDQSEAA
jgi:hypothetical protein